MTNSIVTSVFMPGSVLCMCVCVCYGTFFSSSGCGFLLFCSSFRPSICRVRRGRALLKRSSRPTASSTYRNTRGSDTHRSSPVSRHVMVMRTNVIHLWIVSQSTIVRLLSCSTERNVNQYILNRVWVRVRVKSEKRSHSKCIGLHFILSSSGTRFYRLIKFACMTTNSRDTRLTSHTRNVTTHHHIVWRIRE